MRLFFSFPKIAYLKVFIQKQNQCSFTYSATGATACSAPKDFNFDHNFIQIGQGDMVFEKAKKVLQNWQQFPSNWTTIYAETTPPINNQTVAVFFKMFSFWWLNSARIVYTFDEAHRFGYAYGTLLGHVEKGEEVFWIERNEQDEIFYHIKAFSRPAYWFVWLAYPIARYFQRRFVKDSMQQMAKIVSQNEK